MIFPSGQDAVISVNGVFPESGSNEVFLEAVIISDTKFFVKPGGPGGPRGPGGRASRLSAMILYQHIPLLKYWNLTLKYI